MSIYILGLPEGGGGRVKQDQRRNPSRGSSIAKTPYGLKTDRDECSEGLCMNEVRETRSRQRERKRRSRAAAV